MDFNCFNFLVYKKFYIIALLSERSSKHLTRCKKKGSYNFMGYESGKTYWIVPRYNTNVALSVYGNTQVSQNRNVIVWSKQNIADQL